ncbi:MAG: hypothetical protein AB1486_00810 [Planctomycetota bacterium]
MRLLLSLIVLALLPPSFALASGCSSTDSPDRVVLKSGQVLEGTVRGMAHGLFEFDNGSGATVPLARAHVRAVEGEGAYADPGILWRTIPAPAGGGTLPQAPEAFLRTSKDPENGLGSLDVAVVAYEHPETHRRVYLVGAIHVAHASFYQAVQSILDAMDLVLWEGVGSKEKPSREAAERFDVIFRAQIMLRNILNLDFQLDEVDYKRRFWRNSDMSINELERLLKERNLEIIPNEKLFRLVFGTLFSIVDPESFPRNETIARPYRAMLAPFLANQDAFEQIFAQAGGEGMKEIVIEARNRVVIKDLTEILSKPGPQRIGVFYGAAHLPDMDKAVREELGLQFKGLHWIPAWWY